MSKTKVETNSLVEQAETDTHSNPLEPAASKEGTRVGHPVAGWTAQDQVCYGPAPVLPFESEECYGQINKWLKRDFGGYQSRFEYHLLKEMVDSVLMQQRWDQAEAALTNRLGRQLMEQRDHQRSSILRPCYPMHPSISS
jgi:hypothetical protein